MKEDWIRHKTHLELSKVQAQQLLAPLAIPAPIADLTVLTSGFSNTNYQVTFRDDAHKPLVIRLIEHADKERMSKEIKINEFIKGLPQPKFIYHQEEDSPIDLPYIVMEYIEGKRLDALDLPLKPEQITKLGHSLGAALATIHKVKFAEAGFLNGMLIVDKPIKMTGRSLNAFANQVLIEQGRQEMLGKSLSRRLMAFIEEEGELLNSYKSLPCLCHSDFGSSNILIDCDQMTVTAILDFEFAFAGTPYVDFGNLLRPPFGLEAGVREAVASGYKAAGGQLPDNWYHLSLLTDLFAWLEFLSRDEVPEPVLDSIRIIVSETITNWLWLE